MHNGQNECAGCAVSDEMTFRLYFGATVKNPAHGMFSFFPAKLHAANSSGFARPVISGLDSIADKMNQGFKSTSLKNECEAYVYWFKVAKIILREGLVLGTSSEMPQEKK